MRVDHLTTWSYRDTLRYRPGTKELMWSGWYTRGRTGGASDSDTALAPSPSPWALWLKIDQMV